jgi:FkbM family methyltransferase
MSLALQKNTLTTKWVAALQRDSKRFGHSLEFGKQLQIRTTTLDQLFRDYGVPFFVKIDVEGHELSVLLGLQKPVPVPYISF